MKPENYSEVLKVLEQREFPTWHPIMEGGKPLWDQLMVDLDASPKRLSDRQSINAMLVAMRLRQWGDTRRLINVLEKHAESTSMEIRSEAAKYLAGFITLSRDPSHKNERIEVSSIPPVLKRAQNLGLKKDVSSLVDKVTGGA